MNVIGYLFKITEKILQGTKTAVRINTRIFRNFEVREEVRQRDLLSVV